MCKFKVGDEVIRIVDNAESVNDVEKLRYTGIITSISDCGKYIRFNNRSTGSLASAFGLKSDYPNPPRKHHDVATEWFMGADIEYYCTVHEMWKDIEYPTWRDDYEYRVKKVDKNKDKIKMIEKEMRRLADELAKLKDE